MPKIEKPTSPDLFDIIKGNQIDDRDATQEISSQELAMKEKVIPGGKKVGKLDPGELAIQHVTNAGNDSGDDSEKATIENIEKKRLNRLHGKIYKKNHPEKKAEMQRGRRKRKREEAGIVETPESTRTWKDPRFGKRQIPEELKKVARQQEYLMHGWRGEADWPDIENKKKK